MNSEPPTTWQKLGAARRRQVEQDRLLRGDAAPFGFASRVVARWQDLVRSERMALWRRWSLRAVVCSLVLLILTVVWNRRSEAAPAALEVPQLSPP
ncbi:MAG: hypothetical protein KA004_08905 [Verrucomicrobiales bacterium]|nr:hypothetical protein [Verrucomicrobiales bacterium]